MADLTELRSRVRALLEDSAGNYIVDGEIDDWLNEAYLDISARERLLHAETSGTTSGNSIALPSTFVSVISLRLGTTDVHFVDDDLWWAYSDEAADPDTTLGRVFNETIELYPTPTTGTAYKIRYVKKPTALSAGADVPAIPEELHKKLVFYATSRGKLKEGQEGMSDRYLAMYEEGLSPLNSRSRVVPGPFNITMQAGPFDTSESAHI